MGTVFIAILCTTVIHSHKHTQMNSSYRCTRAACWFRFCLGSFCVFCMPIFVCFYLFLVYFKVPVQLIYCIDFFC